MSMLENLMKRLEALGVKNIIDMKWPSRKVDDLRLIGRSTNTLGLFLLLLAFSVAPSGPESGPAETPPPTPQSWTVVGLEETPSSWPSEEDNNIFMPLVIMGGSTPWATDTPLPTPWDGDHLPAATDTPFQIPLPPTDTPLPPPTS